MGRIITIGDRNGLAGEAGETTMGTYLMIVLTLLFFGVVAYYVLSMNLPEKAPVTGFEVTPLNGSTIEITSLAGSSIPANKVVFIVGDRRVNLDGLDDRNGNRRWDAGETAFVGPFDITKPTRFVITSGTYLLLETSVKFAGVAAGNTSFPLYSPGLTATYYRDETWTAAAATRIAPEIRFADDAGSAIGHASAEAHWPVPEIGQDEAFSVKFEGALKVDAEADYTFYLTSDDGSFLYIDGAQVINNGGLHSATVRTGTTRLPAGYHNITVRMFEHTGQAVIRLEYSSPAMPRTIVTAFYHIPDARPVSDFTAIPTVANAPATIQFRDASTDATAWSWDFGDGGTSGDRNPSHTYAANGNYTVRLTASNSLGSFTTSKNDYIRLGAALPGFTATYYRDETWGTLAAVKSVPRIRFSDDAGAAIGHASDEAHWPVPEIGQDEAFSVKIAGALKVDAEADYTFYLTSDDGSYLSIDGVQIIDNGGLHSATEKSGTVHLKAGYHALEVKMYEHTGHAVLRLEYASPAMARKFVSDVYS